MIIIIRRFVLKVYRSRIFNYENYSCLLYPMRTGWRGDSRMKRGNSKESSASRLAPGKRYYANDIKDTYPCLYTVVLPVIRVEDRDEANFQRRINAISRPPPRGEKKETDILFLFSRQVAWTTRPEENFWVNRKTRTPVTIPYRTCNFGERVFNAGENFQSWRKASITAKLGGKIPCRSSRIPPRAKINRRRFTVSKRYFFLSAQFRRRTASRINWNNICWGFS